MVLSLEIRSILDSKYGIKGPELPGLSSLSEEEISRIIGVEMAQERKAIKIEYDAETYRLRFFPPLPGSNGDREVKYWAPPGSHPSVYIPPELQTDENNNIIITEGELKAYRAWRGSGLACLALAGIMSWRTGEVKDDSLGLLPSLDRDWSGKNLVLIYDSDIRPGHPGYPSFVRLGLQLYN